MDPAITHELHSRLQERVLAWNIRVEETVHATSSVVALGHRGHQPVVLKVVKQLDEEWYSGRVLETFAGGGTVRALAYVDGAVLLERLIPGTLLSDAKVSDDEATAIIADVIGRMSPGRPPSTAPTIESWGEGFERHRARDTAGIPHALVEEAHRTYVRLCAS